MFIVRHWTGFNLFHLGRGWCDNGSLSYDVISHVFDVGHVRDVQKGYITSLNDVTGVSLLENFVPSSSRILLYQLVYSNRDLIHGLSFISATLCYPCCPISILRSFTKNWPHVEYAYGRHWNHPLHASDSGVIKIYMPGMSRPPIFFPWTFRQAQCTFYWSS